MSGQTRRLGDRKIEIYTDILGMSMLFILWSDKQTLVGTERFKSVELAEARAELFSSVAVISMEYWRQHFADEPNGFFPCGEEFDTWKARKDAEAS